MAGKWIPEPSALEFYFLTPPLNKFRSVLKNNPPPLRGEDFVEVGGGFEPP
jgi:hypothetical protein